MDTIAAIATARGQAALAIIRVSGPQAVAVVDSCFRGADLTAVPSHTVHVGYLLDPGGASIDQVVVTLFRAPRSATGEDVVEVSCHGGDFAPRLILDSIVAHGARFAEPGEFTQRAFLNGKVDLAQAEAVADLIHASSSLAHRVSLAHLQGRYSEVLQRLRSELLDLCALVELELDFAEEDVAFADVGRLEGLLDRAATLIEGLLNSYQVGALIRDGVRVVIGGRPNAGKSTLLNALLGRDRAIVSPVPGTTRDEIEAEVEVQGLRFRFVDTAGLRATSDAVEAEGVRRAEQSIEACDALLYVFDLTEGLDPGEAEFLARLRADQPALPVLLVGNKLDLAGAANRPPETAYPCLRVSAQKALSEAAVVATLLDRLVEAVTSRLSDAEASPVVMNLRHRRHLTEALRALSAARAALAREASGDALALDLRVALHELGAITGEITNEDVLGQIFSKFCIGK
jgi:tRNA modification GTPase